MKVLPHNFIISPVTPYQYCSNCGIVEDVAGKIGSTQCAYLSQAEKNTIVQSRWFEGFFNRQLAKLDKLDAT